MDFSKELQDLGHKTHLATKLSLSTIGTKVAKDGKFFDRIAKGGGFTMKTYSAVKAQLLEMLAKAEPEKDGRS